ncbi:MAG: AraC family ligand binding domain-containing protein [Clostridiales bacterium]|jgi:mannose-6-phosphate isomerase-like protein (cupin superfamily)|nr:AraC family ligand binding domain-containing protein [Clostridiales bacterium]
MNEPINWKDSYYISKDRIVLTSEQIHIPGVRIFGMHNMHSAVSPLMPHFHENCIEVTFITKGSVLFYAGDAEYKANGGDAFIAFANEVHSTHETPMSVGEIYWLQLDISDSGHFLFLAFKEAKELISQIKKNESPV